MERTVLMEMKHTPFPLKRNLSENGMPFFELFENGRRGHNSPRGGIYWEDMTYSDNRVLVSLSKNFNPAGHPVIIVYLHGNQTILDRDLMERQQLPTQISESGINAMFIAPQLAVDALDSSAGHFVEPNYFARFVDEAIENTAKWQRNKSLLSALRNAPVILAAFSGGYMPAVFALERGGMGKRIKGVVLLDAVYSHEEKFLDWIVASQGNFFFFSAYTQSTRPNNEMMQRELESSCIAFGTTLPDRISRGQITFLDLGDGVDHNELPVKAWREYPVEDVFSRVKHIRYASGNASHVHKRKFSACRRK